MSQVRWIVLGIAHAVPHVHHANTHFLCVDEERVVLLDCPPSTTTRLPRVGLDPLRVTDVVLTHFHPDHVGGVPELLTSLWLMGRRTPLHIYGLEDTLSRLQQMMALYEWSAWPNFFPVGFHPVPEGAGALVLKTEHTRWRAFPVCHLLPTMGIRVEMPAWGRALGYTADTEFCPTLEPLARGVDALFHEATGEMPGHSTPAQAAALAKRMGAKHLYLVHLNPKRQEEALAEARRVFPATEVPGEFMVLKFP